MKTKSSSGLRNRRPTHMRSRRQTQTLLSIQLLNMLGDGLLGIGTTLIILMGNNPDRDLTIFLITCSLSGILSLGVASLSLDSINRRYSLILIDVVRIVSALLIVAYQQFWSGTALLVIAGLCVGFSVSVYRPAVNAYIGDTVPAEERTAANSFRSMSSKISSILGPSTAAALATAHLHTLIPLLSLGITLISLVAFYIGPTGTVHGRVGKTRGEHLAAVRYIRSRPWVLAVITQGAIQFGFVGAPMAIIAPLWLSGHAAANQYGYLAAVEAIGATLAAVILMRLEHVAAWLTMPVLLLEITVLAVIATDAPIAWLYPAYFVLGAGASVFGVLWIGALQAQVPTEMLGRVLAIDALGNSVLTTVGLGLAGVAVHMTSVTTVAFAAIGVLIASVLAAMAVPGVVTLGKSGQASCVPSGSS